MPENNDSSPDALTQALKSKAEPKKLSKAPYPPKTKLRYIGIQRLFAGYQVTPVLEPGQLIEVDATLGEYSFYVVERQGVGYRFLIDASQKGDWVPG